MIVPTSSEKITTGGFVLSLKNPFFFVAFAIVFVVLQVGISFYSINSFLDGDLLVGFSFFLLVPFLAFLMALYYAWFRRQRRQSSPSQTAGENSK